MEDMKKIGRPLTLEQLRKMEGMPAYWPDAGCWGIISVDSMGRWAGIPFFCGKIKEVNITYNIKERGISVYAYPPAHINREAWEPCESCMTCDTCKNMDEYNPYEGMLGDCGTCYKKSNYNPDNFCRKCGRPLTDKAWDELEKRIGGAK